MLKGLSYRPCGQTFAVLVGQDSLAVLSFTPAENSRFTYRISAPVNFSDREIAIVSQKLDRIHQFHCGYALGVVQKMRQALKMQAERPDPVRFRTECQALLDDMAEDLRRYAAVQGLNPVQFEFFDSATAADEHIYSAEIDRNSQAVRQG